jgi:hypothetical protein
MPSVTPRASSPDIVPDTPARNNRVRVSNTNPIYGLVEGAKRGNEKYGRFYVPMLRLHLTFPLQLFHGLIHYVRH